MNKTNQPLAGATALALLLSVLLVSGLSAQTNTIKITADGYGDSPEQAGVASLRAAVEQAVGTFLDSETQVANEEVIKDQVLSHSDGFVEKVIDPGQPVQVQDGFWKVTKTVLVRKGKLQEKLKAGGLITASVSGEDIWAREVSKIQNVNDGRALLKKFLHENTMNKLLVARLVDAQGNAGDQAKPEIKTDYDTGKTTVTFRIQVYYDLEAYYNQYVPKLIKLLDQIMVVDNESYPVVYRRAVVKLNRASWRSGPQNPIAEGEYFGVCPAGNNQRSAMAFQHSLRDDQKNLIFINIGRDKLGQNMRYKVYRLPEDGGEFYYKDLVEPFRSKSRSHGGPGTQINIPKLQIFVMDKDGQILRQNDFYGQGLDVNEHGYSYAHLGEKATKQLYLSTATFRYKACEDAYRHFLFEPRFLVDQGSLQPPAIFITPSSYGVPRSALFFSDSLTYSYPIEMDVEDTKNLGTIEMRFP